MLKHLLIAAMFAVPSYVCANTTHVETSSEVTTMESKVEDKLGNIDNEKLKEEIKNYMKAKKELRDNLSPEAKAFLSHKYKKRKNMMKQKIEEKVEEHKSEHSSK